MFPKKLLINSQKYVFGIRDPEKSSPDPFQGSKRHWIPDLDPQYVHDTEYLVHVENNLDENIAKKHSLVDNVQCVKVRTICCKTFQSKWLLNSTVAKCSL